MCPSEDPAPCAAWRGAGLRRCFQSSMWGGTGGALGGPDPPSRLTPSSGTPMSCSLLSCCGPERQHDVCSKAEPGRHTVGHWCISGEWASPTRPRLMSLSWHTAGVLRRSGSLEPKLAAAAIHHARELGSHLSSLRAKRSQSPSVAGMGGRNGLQSRKIQLRAGRLP